MKVKHSVSLTVCAQDFPQRREAFGHLSRLAAEIEDQFEACNVSAYGFEDDGLDRAPGDEYFDEYTLLKVVHALREAGIPDQQAEDAINQMQNAGVLFRERAR